MASNYLTQLSGQNYDMYCRNINISGTYTGPTPPLPTDIVYDTLTQINGNSGVDINGNIFGSDIKYDTFTQSNALSAIDIAGNIHGNNIQGNDIGAQGNISSAINVVVGNTLQTDNITSRAVTQMGITAGVGTTAGTINMRAKGSSAFPPALGIINIRADPASSAPALQGEINLRGVTKFRDNANVERLRIDVPQGGGVANTVSIFTVNSERLTILGSIIDTGGPVRLTDNQILNPPINPYDTTTGVAITNIALNGSTLYRGSMKCTNVDEPTARTLNFILPSAADIDAYMATIIGSVPIAGFSFTQELYVGTLFTTGAATNSLTITVSSSTDGTAYADSITTTNLSSTIKITKCQVSAAGRISYLCTLY